MPACTTERIDESPEPDFVLYAVGSHGRREATASSLHQIDRNGWLVVTPFVLGDVECPAVAWAVQGFCTILRDTHEAHFVLVFTWILFPSAQAVFT